MKKSSNKANKTKSKPAITKPAISRVRIIGGQFKRRNVSFIDAEGLRPTPDRLRETLFNWLLADIHASRVLDSCAGSGVLGFEALSRGAAFCTFIETNQAQSQILLQNAQQLRLDDGDYCIIHGAAEQVLNSPHSFGSPFDIVFIDPPYSKDLWQPILTTLIDNHLITAETLIYLESDKDLTALLETLAQNLSAILNKQNLNGFECLKQTKAGQVVAGLYRLVPS